MIDRKLRIVVFTAWYATKRYPTFGVFIKEQAQALAVVHDLTLVAILRAPRSSRKVSTEGSLSIIAIEDPMWSITTKGKLARWSAIAKQEVEMLQSIEPIDVIHLHDLHPTIAATSLREHSSATIISTLHNTDITRNTVSKSYHRALKKGLESCDKVVAVGSDLHDAIRAQYALDNTVVIPNIVDTDRFTIGTPTLETKELIVIAGLRKIKRVSAVIRAMSIVTDHSVKLHVVGDGPLMQELTELVVQLALEDRVRLHGTVSRELLPQLMQQCRINISNSTVETFGISAMEGLSAGLPLIYSESGLEKLIPDYAGICTDGSSEQVAAAISKVLDNFDSYDRPRLRSYVVKRYSKEKIVSELTALYHVTKQDKSVV